MKVDNENRNWFVRLFTRLVVCFRWNWNIKSLFKQWFLVITECLSSFAGAILLLVTGIYIAIKVIFYPVIHLFVEPIYNAVINDDKTIDNVRKILDKK